MTYIRVADIPASWPDFTPPDGSAGASGLILYAAGPTSDGIRTVEVWASRTDWTQRAAPAKLPANATVREWDAPVSVLGAGPSCAR